MFTIHFIPFSILHYTRLFSFYFSFSNKACLWHPYLFQRIGSRRPPPWFCREGADRRCSALKVLQGQAARPRHPIISARQMAGQYTLKSISLLFILLLILMITTPENFCRLRGRPKNIRRPDGLPAYFDIGNICRPDGRPAYFNIIVIDDDCNPLLGSR